MQANIDLFPKFLQNLNEHKMVEDDQRVLLAVSGGPDSMALLHLFFRWNPERIAVWHLNHGFREESHAEAKMVQTYCESQGIPVEICQYDVTSFIKKVQQSKLHGARTIRYQLLHDFAASNGYQRIALGHHADDQVETVLMNLLRGTGMTGLRGMLPKRGIYIRPLLTITKDELIQYCLSWDIPYAEDVSNTDTDYFRNRLRYELIPLLEKEYNRGVRSNLLHLSEVVRAEDEELDRIVTQICSEHTVWQNEQMAFPRHIFVGLSTALQRRVLRELLARYKGDLRRIGFEHIEVWRSLILAGGAFQLQLPQTTVWGTANYIYVGIRVCSPWESQVLPVPGKVLAGDWVVQAEVFSKNELPQPTVDSEDFSLDALNLPLVVRPRQAGDRMIPFGTGFQKKVSRLMVEAHFPLWLRDFLPLVTDGSDILWVPEVKRAEKGRLLADTSQVVRLTCYPLSREPSRQG